MAIELMSPAGNIESFYAAMESGADSVYLGLKKFNARRPAANFTLNQLKQIIEFAHGKNKKVYLTLNIDLKSNELKEAAQILELAGQLKIDAVIVKDFSIICLIQKFYNNLKFHLSTQCGICSSLGVIFASSIGAERVVLSRELTIEEIKDSCSINNNIQCEIFAEGSMCFSISGRCLMSSWVGGRSGNRGLCTAPCRIQWQSIDQSGSFFSMKDLSLLNYLDNIKKTNVKALKIEGRLKNAAWVKTITEIYKDALDKQLLDEDVKILCEELKKYSARETGSGHLSGHNDLTGKNENWNNYQKTEKYTIQSEIIKTNNTINIIAENDNLIININMFEKENIIKTKIPPCPKKAKLISINELLVELNNNDLIKEYNFKINKINDKLSFANSFINNTVKNIINKIRIIIKEEEKLPELSQEILEFIQQKKIDLIRKKLLGDYPDKIIIFSKDSQKFLNINLPIDTIVISLEDTIDIESIKILQKKYKIILSIPPILYEKRAKTMQSYITQLFKEGFNNFEANSYTGMEILSKIECNKTMGIDMPVMNHLSACFLHNLNYSSVYTSLEGENSIFKSLSSFAKGKVDCLIFGKIVLFQTRVESPEFNNITTFKDKYTEIECHKLKEITVFVSKIPFALLGNKIKEERIYFDNLSADLRYFKNPDETLRDIFKNKFNDKNTNSFNFYRKLL